MCTVHVSLGRDLGCLGNDGDDQLFWNADQNDMRQMQSLLSRGRTALRMKARGEVRAGGVNVVGEEIVDVEAERQKRYRRNQTVA